MALGIIHEDEQLRRSAPKPAARKPRRTATTSTSAKHKRKTR